MKRIIKTIAYIASAVLLFSCAKNATVGPNDANLLYFESWMKLNYPDLKPTGLGVYIIPEAEVEGTGAEVKRDGFVYVDYIATDLEGNIDSYTDKATAKQMGAYDTTTYYGSHVFPTTAGTIPAGIAEAIVGMKAGGHRKVIIPNWLMSYQSYDSADKYLATATTEKHYIYDITVTDYADSINVHEIALINKFVSENPLDYNFDSRMTNDTTGFYYQPIEEGTTEGEYGSDAKIYINYTGRLLNGLVFDTTYEKVAKDNGLYSAGKTYGPVLVNLAENYTDITMGTDASSVIPGFALTIKQMRPMAKGIGIFYSPLGYSYNGSGTSIPGYAPLIFEIEIVPEPA